MSLDIDAVRSGTRLKSARKRRRSILEAFVGYIEDTIPQISGLLPHSSPKLPVETWHPVKHQGELAPNSSISGKPKSAMKRPRTARSLTKPDQPRSAVSFKGGAGIQHVQLYSGSGPVSSISSSRRLNFDKLPSRSGPVESEVAIQPEQELVADYSIDDESKPERQSEHNALILQGSIKPTAVSVPPSTMVALLLPGYRSRRRNRPVTLCTTHQVSSSHGSAFNLVGRKRKSITSRDIHRYRLGPALVVSQDDGDLAVADMIYSLSTETNSEIASQVAVVPEMSDSYVPPLVKQKSMRKSGDQYIFVDPLRLVSPGRCRSASSFEFGKQKLLGED